MERLARLDDRWETWTQSRSARRVAWAFAAVTVGLWVALVTVVAQGGDDRIDSGLEKALVAAALFGGFFVLAGAMAWVLKSASQLEAGTPARSAVVTFLAITAVFAAVELGFGHGLAGVVRALLAAAAIGIARYFHARRSDAT